MAKKYGYVCSNQELPDNYIDPNGLFFSLNDDNYAQIIENSSNGTLRIIEKRGIEILHVTNPSGKPISESTLHALHAQLMFKLIDHIPNGSTVLFHDISDLSPLREYGLRLYHHFLERQIELTFSQQSTLNTINFLLLGDRSDKDIAALIDRMISSGYADLETAKNKYPLNPDIYQLNRTNKKKLR